MRTTCVILLVLLTAGFALADDEMQINGFVDASYAGNITTGNGEFGLDQAEIDILRDMGDTNLLRVDIDYAKAGNGFSCYLEQGYMNFKLPMVDVVDFTIGKFNAPIGFELLDAPDMYQYSHSLVFDYCLPTNLTGLMGGYAINDAMDIVLYATNGWDRNADNNDVLTFGGRFGFTQEKFGVGVSAIMGSEDANQNEMQTVFDIDLTLNLSETILIGGEFNMGSIAYDTPNADDASWTGMMVMCHYTVNDWLGATCRFDMVNDSDGELFGFAPGTTEGFNRSSITLAPTFVLGEGLGALIEYRMDMASEDVFLDADNAATGSESTVAFEMTYTF